MSTSFSDIEQETITLCSLTDLIDTMVSPSMFHVVGDPPHVNILFHTSKHAQLFSILFQDFLARPDRLVVGHDLSGPEALDLICKKPNFSVNNSCSNLRISVQLLLDWLAEEPRIEVWFPSIEFDGTLQLSRSTQVSICGNLSKHYLLRQSRQARKMKNILRDAGCEVGLEDALRAMSDFYERFHDDIFMYHSSTIAELLNNIQWGIYEYLLPFYRQVLVKENSDAVEYDYRRHPEIVSDFAFSLYWDLLNWVRRGRIVERFSASKYLKKQY